MRAPQVQPGRGDGAVAAGRRLPAVRAARAALRLQLDRRRVVLRQEIRQLGGAAAAPEEPHGGRRVPGDLRAAGVAARAAGAAVRDGGVALVPRGAAQPAVREPLPPVLEGGAARGARRVALRSVQPRAGPVLLALRRVRPAAGGGRSSVDSLS